jgi:hypothetical protein
MTRSIPVVFAVAVFLMPIRGAAADSLLIGTEAVNASTLTASCVGENGLFRVVQGSEGFVLVTGLPDDEGIAIVKSSIGRPAASCHSCLFNSNFLS